jgi:hypothetical protein
VISGSVEDGRLERRKKCFKNSKILKVTFREHIRRTQVFELFSKFKSSLTSSEGVDCLGCPLMSNR